MTKPNLRITNAVTLLSFFLIFIVSCQRDVDSSGFGGNNGNTDATVIAGMRGTVIDENSQPVVGATVISGTKTTTTDRYGNFQFNNISLSKANGYVRVEKAGYFNGNRSFVTTAGRIHNVRIRLIPKTNSGNFIASAGGTVTLSSGAKLVIPANAVTDASGNAYTGQVNIAMTWIDPKASNLPEIVPGDLRGWTTSNEERGLETYGMIGVEMTGAGNAPLKIASGKTGELTFPVPATMVSSAPATIDLWHFDETTGKWKQEGTATKTGNNYVANVSHFSFWNCDAPFPLINLCMTIVNAANSQPLNNVQVRIQRPNGSYGYGWTDSLGNLCGKVPKNEALVLQVMSQCNSVVYTQNIGPFTADASLGNVPVTLPANSNLIVSGTLTNCAGANVTNGVVVIHTSGPHTYYIPVTNGAFSLTLLACGSAINFTVQGFDYTGLKQSTLVTNSGTTGIVNLGTIQACSTTIEEYTEFIIDGSVYFFMFPPDSFGSMDTTLTSGPYTHKTGWTGSKGNSGTTANYAWFNVEFLNNALPGVLPVSSMYFAANSPAQFTLSSFVNPNPTINITTIGTTVNSVIEGSFNEPMVFGTGTKNVQCNFRIRRN